MIPRFFIDRPIFAAVLSVFITLAGTVAVASLPVSQYPPIAPPTIQIDCNYPGASALVVSQSVAAPIEQQVNGVEDMLYMSSQCTSDGSYTCTITFKSDTDLNMAQVRVQNRVNLAMPQLPDVVRATGVTTRKRSPELLLTVGVTSLPEPGYPNGRYDQLHLSNYAVLHLREELQRLPGISDVTIFGQRDYAVRIWLDPDKLAALKLSANDVVNAIQQQNTPLAAGQIGQPPAGTNQPYQFTLSGVGRLVEPEEFGKIVVKVGTRQQLVRIRDVARIELGAKSSDVSNLFDGKATVGLAIFVLPDCNALETGDAVREAMARMSKEFPPGIAYEIGYDTTPFIRESIDEVFKSLRDAIILVSIVVLLFLQSWRAAIIPLAAVPVAIIGTFAAMAAVGYSVNLLTLFGLVLAVGIVVDDAIVVVEAVQHQLELGFATREATIRAMEQVTGPIIAVGVVLSFVFFPCIFFPGVVGAFFRQFALTIAVSTLISTFNSLTLSPALCALLLKPKSEVDKRRPLPRLAFALLGAALAYLYLTRHVARVVGWLPAGVQNWLGPIPPWQEIVAASVVGAAVGFALGGILNRILGLLFAGFDRVFNFSGRVYVKIVSKALRVPLLVLAGYAAVVGMGFAGFQTMPTGFIPQQDKGYLVCSIQLPDNASTQRTEAVIAKISRIALDLEIDIPAVEGEDGAVRVKTTKRVPVPSDKVEPVKPNEIRFRLLGHDFSMPLRPDEKRVVARVDGEQKNLIRVSRWALVRKEDGTPEVVQHLEWFEEVQREEWVRKVKPIKHVNAVAGNSFVLSAYGSNFGSMFVILDDFVNRRHDKLTADAVATELRKKFAASAPEGQVNVFGAPAVPRLGRAGGFRIMIEDRGDVGPDVLQGQTDNFIEKANQQKQLVGLFTVFKTDSPQIFLDVDRAACVARGLDISDVYAVLQGTMGSNYVNDFNRWGRTWQVNVQSDQRFRRKIEDIRNIQVRNKSNEMVPLGSVLQVNTKDKAKTAAPLVITRYNMYPAAAVNGNFSPGTSTGDGIAIMEKLAEQELPARMSYEWTELTFLEKQSRNTGGLVFLMSVAFVFLVLAALYESWAFPFAVMLVVPVCVACSLAAVWITDPGSVAETLASLGLMPSPSTEQLNQVLNPIPKNQQVGLRYYENTGPARFGRWFDTGLIATVSRWVTGVGIGKQDVNVFTQVGFVVLIGLACKNAILIVEFAKVARDKGADLHTAILDACKLRYRPILMTSVAFMLGVLPLAVARGAGAEMRQAIGIAVLGGMLGVTVFGIFLTPVFFSVVDRLMHGPVFSHPWVTAVGAAGLYVLKLKFVPPLARGLRDAAAAGVRRVRTRRPGSPK